MNILLMPTLHFISPPTLSQCKVKGLCHKIERGLERRKNDDCQVKSKIIRINVLSQSHFNHHKPLLTVLL